MAMKMSLAYQGKETPKEEKEEGATSRRKKEREGRVPEGAKSVSHTFRKIENGWLQSTSYKHPKTGEYENKEYYHESPDTFSDVEGV